MSSNWRRGRKQISSPKRIPDDPLTFVADYEQVEGTITVTFLQRLVKAARRRNAVALTFEYLLARRQQHLVVRH
jgi:hypothetical protein